MKKRILAAIFAVSAIFMMSSCQLILWGDNDITIHNQSDRTLYNVCAIDEYGETTYVSGNNIRSGSCKTIRDLPDGYYVVRFKMAGYDTEYTREFSVYRDRDVYIRDYKDWDNITNLVPGNTVSIELDSIN